MRRLINNQGEIIKQGIAVSPDNWNNRTIYEYTELNSIKPDMIADATKNAREAANKFAADSGSKIGKIKTAQQGQFSIEDRDPYTPVYKESACGDIHRLFYRRLTTSLFANSAVAEFFVNKHGAGRVIFQTV